MYLLPLCLDAKRV